MAKDWSGFFHNGCYFVDCVHNEETVKSNPMDSWDVRDDDIVIVTYPKSGTYWMMKALTSICSDAAFLLPATKRAVRLDLLCEDAGHIPGMYGEHVQAVKTSLQEMSSPRLFYYHLFPQLFPKSWREGKKRCKIICVTRNPKDVCVSYYLYMKAVPWGDMNLNWEEWVKAFVEGKVWGGAWLDQVWAWKQYGLQENVLHVSFEDMKGDLTPVLAQIARFLDRPLSDDELDDIAENCSFEAMCKGVEMYRQYSSSADKYSFVAGARHQRKGQVGDWKNHFTVAQSEFFDREVTEKAENRGINVVYQIHSHLQQCGSFFFGLLTKSYKYRSMKLESMQSLTKI